MRNSLLFALFLLGALPAAAADINVLALTAGKAVLVIDGGKPRTLAVGETSPEKVKLVSATSEAAIVEVDGQRRRLTLGDRISIAGSAAGAQSATLTADARGHFFTTAAVNGISIRFIVDTGASMVTLSATDAKRAGVAYLSAPRGLLQTANGVVAAYRVKLDTVRLGPITLHNVDGVVVETNALGGAGLLGLSFLNRTEMRRDGDTMTLTRRY
ncbi:MAG TPA: TIGR02281 family clan AA aspartic protease [Burkholderiales bacterium]|nr:TIGR02281 family clan AA aspartic protease [Burkholderiales bacterium]